MQRLLAIPPSIHKLPPQRRQARAPPNRQPPAQLLLDLCSLLRHPPLALALRHGIHGAGQEQADRFVDVLLCDDDAEIELRERFGNPDYGFELPDCDWDRGAGVGGELGGVDLASDGDEVRGELFGGFGGEAWGTASGFFGFSWFNWEVMGME